MAMKRIISNYLKLNFSNVDVILVFIVVLLTSFFLFNSRKKKKNTPPGPIGVPLLGYFPFLGNHPAKKLLHLTKKYGDVFSFYLGTKYTVILNEYNVAKDILSHEAVLNRPPNLFGTVNIGFSQMNGPKWKEQRKLFLSTMRDIGIGRKTWELQVQREVAKFVDNIERQNGKPIDVTDDLMVSLSKNFISFVIGREVDDQNTLKLIANFSKNVLDYYGPHDLASLFPFLRKWLIFFKIGGYDQAAKALDDVKDFFRNEIERHKSCEELQDVHDFINSYFKEESSKIINLKLKENEETLSDEILEGNINSLMLGAVDTTWSSMNWMLRLLAKYKDKQQKVYNELMENFGKDESISYEDRNKMPYSVAFLMEMHRFATIAPLGSLRAASKDITANGYIIPKGATILSNVWAIHNDPTYWKNPEIFEPERFLTDDNAAIIKDVSHFLPFSLGKRNCPGEIIAWILKLTYMTQIVRKFEVCTPEGMENRLEGNNQFVSFVKPMPLCYKKRVSSETLLK